MADAISMFVERAAPGSVRGDHWRVSWYDAELQKFVGGEGGSAWAALAWAMVCREETRRGILVIARNPTDTPGEVLARLGVYAGLAADFDRRVFLPRNPIIEVTPARSHSHIADALQYALNGGGAQTGTPAQVASTPSIAPATFTLSPEQAPKPSAAARRSRTTKAKKK